MDPASKVASEATALRDERLQELLVKSSRTFALAIPQLPLTMRREITIAYLLFRIADTFEDAGSIWSQERQIAVLAQFEKLLESRSLEQARVLTTEWLDEPPTDHPGYLELLRMTPAVVASWLELRDPARASIGEHTQRTTHMMAQFVRRADTGGVLQLEGLEDLRRYCFAVAGIVGEMLTDLFLLGSPGLERVSDYLRQRAAAFGEGLQLVNILKDSAGDAIEGRNYLPSGVGRAEIFALARTDLEAAAEYVLMVQRAGGPSGVVAFTALPVELAWATLDRVEKLGPGSKISRYTVFQLHNRVRRLIAEGRPVLECSGTARSLG
jgi:farnesyl-diphosphate farnesyltransferase